MPVAKESHSHAATFNPTQYWLLEGARFENLTIPTPLYCILTTATNHCFDPQQSKNATIQTLIESPIPPPIILTLSTTFQTLSPFPYI